MADEHAGPGPAQPTGQAVSPTAKGAAGVAILIAAFLFYQYYSDGNDDDNVNNATCAMTAAAVPLFAEAVTRGRASAAVDTMSGVLTVGACKVALKDLQESPSSQVPLEVETGSGVVQRAVTAPELTTQPPQPAQPNVSVSQLIACGRSYNGPNQGFLLQLCYDGILQPTG